MEEGSGCGYDLLEPSKFKSGWFWIVGTILVVVFASMITLLANSYGCINSAKVICTEDKATGQDQCRTFDHATYEIKYVGGMFDSRYIITDKRAPDKTLSILESDIASETGICLDP